MCLPNIWCFAISIPTRFWCRKKPRTITCTSLCEGRWGWLEEHETPENVTLFALDAGDLVGELSFLDGTRHYASLVAIGPTRVFGLEREKLEALLPVHPEIVYRVMRAIIRTVHEIQRRISMHSVELTNYIYKQHGRY